MRERFDDWDRNNTNKGEEKLNQMNSVTVIFKWEKKRRRNIRIKFQKVTIKPFEEDWFLFINQEELWRSEWIISWDLNPEEISAEFGRNNSHCLSKNKIITQVYIKIEWSFDQEEAFLPLEKCFQMVNCIFFKIIAKVRQSKLFGSDWQSRFGRSFFLFLPMPLMRGSNPRSHNSSNRYQEGFMKWFEKEQFWTNFILQKERCSRRSLNRRWTLFKVLQQAGRIGKTSVKSLARPHIVQRLKI